MIEAGWHFYDPPFEDIIHITTSFSLKAGKPRKEIESESACVREKECVCV